MHFNLQDVYLPDVPVQQPAPFLVHTGHKLLYYVFHPYANPTLNEETALYILDREQYSFDNERCAL